MDRDATSGEGASWESRPLTANDQGLLWDLLYLALWDPPSEPRRPRSVLKNPQIRRLVEDWGRPDDIGLAAIESKSGAVAGAVWARLDRYDGLEDYGCPFPCLAIAIQPESQSKGAGSHLMNRLIEGVAERKVPGLRLCVHPKNKAAIALYRKFGFVQYATGAGGYLQMKRDLNSRGTM